MKNNLVYLFKYIIFIFVLIFNYNNFVFSSEIQTQNDTFIIHNDKLINVPRKYLRFLEHGDFNLTLNKLKESKWENELSTQQSFYDGFWVKIKILNLSSTSEMGIHHHWNFEKRIIYENSFNFKSFNFLDYNNDNYEYMTKDRIWYDYKIDMPTGDITEIYSFFRSRPLDRMNSHSNGLDRIAIGSWEEIQVSELFRAGRYFISLLIYVLFGLYFLIFYFISKENNYLWITLVLAAFSYTNLGFLFSSILGIRFNYLYGPLGFSLIAGLIIHILRNLLDLENNFLKFDRLFKWTIRLYLFFALFYFYDSFDYPDGEIYTNLIKYPIHNYGVGTIPLYLSFIPLIIIAIISLFLIFILWRRGSKLSGYLLLTFSIPIIIGVVSTTARILGIYDENFKINLFVQGIQSFISYLIPIMFGMVLAEKYNEVRKKLIDELEDKVEERTIRLSEANQLITESINSASLIQNAILPKIERENFGFNEFEYLWEPRDIVGGDFYWMDKKDEWTCFVMADCTGHGIPGAFMTLISSTLLDRIKSFEELSQPERILNQLDELLEETLKLKENDATNFGMDAGVCCFSRKNNKLLYSGAKMNLYHKFDNDVQEYKGDKISLGYAQKPHPIVLHCHHIDFPINSSFFMFSDGITDQVGGPKNIMYGKKRILKIISETSDVKNSIQKITKDLESYQRSHKRRDDLSLFGFSIA